MKKSLLENQIHDEPEHVQAFYPGKSNMPRLSYKKAMSSYFLAGDGAIHQVSSCNAFVFQDFVDTCGASVKKPLCGALKYLHFSEQIDRWYALDTLLCHGATIPLFATKEQARAILVEKREDVRK